MTKETFINFLKAYETVLYNAKTLEQVGVDLFDSKFKIVPSVTEMFVLTLRGEYDEEGFEWIEWFVYDNKMGKRGLTARDVTGNDICQTIEELYDYIKLNNKLNKGYEFKLQNK